MVIQGESEKQYIEAMEHYIKGLELEKASALSSIKEHQQFIEHDLKSVEIAETRLLTAIRELEKYKSINQ